MEHFHRLHEFPLVVCKECQHAVWPDQIKGHLTSKHHKLPHKDAQRVAEEVQGWTELLQYPGELEVPIIIDRPIAQLPLHDDGFLCQLDPTRCHYICRSEKSIKEHWRKQHQWSANNGKRGGSVTTRRQIAQRRFNDAAKRVNCQRLFPTNHRSQYFEVRQPEQSREDQIMAEADDVLSDRVWGQAIRKWAEMKKKDAETIQQGEKDEANPWLERTGWHIYLSGFDIPSLIALIAEPNIDPDADEEPVEAAIWEAIGEVARISQASSIHRVRYFTRLEAIRTEKHQTRYQPLQPYKDEESIDDRGRT